MSLRHACLLALTLLPTAQAADLPLDNAVIGPAQWTQYRVSVASDGQGYLAVWQDERSDSDGDIFAARIDATGQLLDAEAFAIATGANPQTFPDVAFDGVNYLVTWPSTGGIFAARVTPNGNVLDPNGFRVRNGNAGTPAVACNTSACLVVWYEGSPGRIWSARISSGNAVGSAFTLTPSTGQQQFAPDVAADSSGFLVTWADKRRGSWDIMAARVGQTGTVLDAPPIDVSMGPKDEYAPVVASSGGQWLVAWQDARGSNTDIYASRISTGGAVLDPTGIAVSAASYDQKLPAVVAVPGTSAFLVAYSNALEAGASTTSVEIRAARVSATGSVLDPTGVAVSGPAVRPQEPALAASSSNFFAAWADQRSGNPDIYGTRISPLMSVLDTSSVHLSRGANPQSEATIAYDGTNYLAAWVDERNGQRRIYGARVTSNGAMLDPNAIAISASSHGYTPAVAFNGSDYLVVWDERDTVRPRGIYGARVTSAGTVLDPGGFPIFLCGGTATCSGPQVVSGGGQWLVGWYYRNSSDRIRLARVSSTGTVLDTTPVNPWPANSNEARGLSLAYDGQNFILASSDLLDDVRVARISSAGAALDPAGVLVTSGRWTHSPSIAFDGSNLLLTYWDQGNSGPSGHRIYATRLSTALAILDTPFSISPSGSDVGYPHVAFAGGAYVVVFQNNGVYRTLVSPSGQVINNSTLLERTAQSPSIAGGPKAAVVYHRYDETIGSNRARLRFVAPPAANGAACLGASDCASGYCVDGVCCNSACGGANASDCQACSLATGASAEGVCSALADATACSDGNACTQTDQCLAGSCVGGNPVVCTAINSCHNVGTCNPASGQCSNPVKPDQSTCDDGNACTQSDECRAGLCIGANPRTCRASDTCHDPGVCDPQSGACSDPPKPDSTPCDDGNACTQTDTCTAGQCVGADRVSCAALGPCSDAACEPSSGQCVQTAKADGTPCSDANRCTGFDACQQGTCQPGALTCAPPSECHESVTCEPADGNCQYQPRADGTPCSAGECRAGACLSKLEPGPHTSGCGCTTTGEALVFPIALLLLALMRQSRRRQ